MAESNHYRTLSATDRRVTARSSTRLSLDTQDEYDLEAMGISDGFRPTTTARMSQNRISSQSSHRERRSTPPPRPSSMTKPRYVDSFALRHDGAMGAQTGRGAVASSSSTAGSITRSSSISTNTPVLVTEGPYQGPAGPSHPYHMYPQNTRLARTASIATTSTAPAPSEGLYTGPSGPTHPYGMYPQNTVLETESLHAHVPFSSNPVGFPGHGGGGEYHRRLGPDGEESGDIIGPLGHTEQLPPYTKYPDEAFARKTALALPPLSGAGGIGLGTRNPEFDSREDVNSPLSRQSNHSITSEIDRHGNDPPLTQSEKPEKKWKSVARKKVWGIVPVWVFVLVGIIILIFCLILGTAVGIIMHQRKGPAPKYYPPTTASGTVFTATVTTTYDAVSLASAPTGIPTLPTGTFLLPISAPIASSMTCLDSPSLYSAWSCQVATSSIQMSVSAIPNCNSKTHCNKITLGQSDMPSAYFYGTQPPVLDTQANMYLVNDSLHLSLGPAWYFAAVYDKLVVAPENSFASPVSEKRSKGDDDSYRQKATAQSGDKPWFCYWNGTTLETFIYVNRSNPSSQQAATSIPASHYGSGPMATPYTWAPSASAAMATSTTSAPATPTSGAQYPGLLSKYPKLIRVGERRNTVEPRYHPPYCVQMHIRSDGTAEPVMTTDNTPVTIGLTETEPALHRLLRRDSEKEYSNSSPLQLTERQDQPQQVCNCVWQT